MSTAEKIKHINQVLHEYFAKYNVNSAVPAKNFMDVFVKAGVFSADNKAGLPIRNLLRNLDRANELHFIPFVIAERKTQNTNWYFGPVAPSCTITERLKENHDKPGVLVKLKLNTAGSKPRSQSDECYILDLCDEILQQPSTRQYRFDFLLGDPNPSGRCSRLPVDALYPALNLVIEYNERQHTQSVKLFDRRMTVSGMTRGEQRSIYDKRKLKVLPENGIQVLVFSYADFQHDSGKRLLRLLDQDMTSLKYKLKSYLK